MRQGAHSGQSMARYYNLFVKTAINIMMVVRMLTLAAQRAIGLMDSAQSTAVLFPTFPNSLWPQ